MYMRVTDQREWKEPFQWPLVLITVNLITFRWTKISATLTGNLLVIHANCMEVARRRIPIPIYCYGDEKININVGKGMKPTELSSSGYSV